MDKFVIKGGKALQGTVAISGAKNSALPAMAASLLTAEAVSLHNIPRVRDIITMAKLLAFMGASVSVDSFPAADYTMEAKSITHAEAPYELVKTMRASILTLGPTLARDWDCARFVAGRMRDWSPAGGFASAARWRRWARRLRRRTDLLKRGQRAGGCRERASSLKRLR